MEEIIKCGKISENNEKQEKQIMMVVQFFIRYWKRSAKIKKPKTSVAQILMKVQNS